MEDYTWLFGDMIRQGADPDHVRKLATNYLDGLLQLQQSGNIRDTDPLEIQIAIDQVQIFIDTI